MVCKVCHVPCLPAARLDHWICLAKCGSDSVIEFHEKLAIGRLRDFRAMISRENIKFLIKDCVYDMRRPRITAIATNEVNI